MRLLADRRRRLALGACALLVLAVFAFRAVRSRKALDAGLSEPLKRGAIQEAVYGIGTVTANRSYQMKTGVTSTVLRVFVKEGDEVQKGARLVELDGIGALSAPFSGTVTALNYKVGETVFAQSIVMTLTDLADRYITVSLEQQAALRVARGMPVVISIDSMRDQRFDGAVEAVYSSGADFLARISAADLPARVLPGMTADVAITVARKSDALLVPVSALASGGAQAVRDGAAPSFVRVETGIVDSAYAEVTGGGLLAGDRVVLEGGARR